MKKGNGADWSDGKLNRVPLGRGLPEPEDIWDELLDMMNVLTGEKDPPVSFGVTNLMEIADAYFIRITELIILIHRRDALDGRKPSRSNDDPYYVVRTKGLENALAACKLARETGSRRLTESQHKLESEIRGLQMAEEL